MLSAVLCGVWNENPASNAGGTTCDAFTLLPSTPPAARAVVAAVNLIVAGEIDVFKVVIVCSLYLVLGHSDCCCVQRMGLRAMHVLAIEDQEG